MRIAEFWYWTLNNNMLKWLKSLWTPKRAIDLSNYPLGLLSPPVSAGVIVNDHTALNISAVWCAINVISNAISTLPIVLYRRLSAGGKVRANEHPLYPLLLSPNAENTRATFLGYLQSQLLRFGNAVAEIERDGAGRPVALWGIDVRTVKPIRDKGGSLGYEVDEGGGKKTYLDSDFCLHVPGLGDDPSWGASPLTLARESLGLTLAAEQHSAAVFGNNSTPGGFISHPGLLSDNARENLRKSWESMHRGPRNSGRLGVLEEGATFNATAFTPADAQLLAQREFQLVEVARWFNLSPVFLHSLPSSAQLPGTLESLNRQLVQQTLMPWLVRWEQELSRKLLSEEERQTYFVEFNVDGLLRADTKARFDAYEKALGKRQWILVNEVRSLENLNPIEGGDDLAPAPGQQPQEDNGEEEQTGDSENAGLA